MNSEGSHSPTAETGPLFLLLDIAGAQVSFPADGVLLVADWCPPLHLPRCARWLVGWCPHEGTATPVIAPCTLHAGPWMPTLAVLLTAGEERYFLPGESARFVRGTARPAPPDSPAHVLGSLSCEDASDISILDPTLLYRAFHLGYNFALDG